MTPAPPANGRLTIDLDAIIANWRKLAKKAPTAKTAAVVKADGYGLGLEKVVAALIGAGCEDFFVATYDEALKTRQATQNIAPKAKIHILSGFLKQAASLCRKFDLRPCLASPEMIAHWLEAGNGDLACALHVETGINRAGLRESHVAALLKNETALEALRPDLVMSHFACADETDNPMNEAQIERFESLCAMLDKGFGGLPRSLANSAGIFLGQKAHYDLTRPGIALYGGEAVNNLANPMWPVVRLEARILQIANVKKGETIGYGATQKFERGGKIAICGIGYADGLLRAASQTGVALRKLDTIQPVQAMLAGEKINYLGRISMDLTAFDVTEIAQSRLDKAEWIEVLNDEILIDDLARSAGTIGYEILTSLGERYQRDYIGG